MGFDNECILNIQSLAGEYFCPVCRLLVYPNEALQSQCTHLYCKPCLTYVVSTTRACPYDGYLVTEADSKPLLESNKALAEIIGKIVVHCLYHRSGCTWQGPLSECTSHCSGCAFGNSPVVCNRCGIQIVHRQVQEHAQNCPGVQPQGQQAEGATETPSAGTASTADQTQTTQVAAVSAQSQTSQSTVTTTPGQDSSQQVNSSSQTQAAVPTAEQWYQQQQQQQQYQQYYQQYPGYDPYQQHYPNYYPYQHAAVPQYQQQHLQAHAQHGTGQHQPQVYMQPQPQSQLQPQQPVQPQSQVQPQPQPQPQAPQVQVSVAAQPQNQAQVNPQQQVLPVVPPHSQTQSQTYPPAHGHPNPQPQPYSQPQPPQHGQIPQYQQPHPQMQHPPQVQQQTQPQILPQHNPPSQAQPQGQLQHPPQFHPPQPNQPPNANIQPQAQHPSAHAVTGHHSYPQPHPHQQMQAGTAQQYPVHVQPHVVPAPQSQNAIHMQSHFPQQPPLMRPPYSHATIPSQQPALLPSPGQVQNITPSKQQSVHSHSQQPGHPVQQRPVMQPVQQPVAQPYYQQQQQPYAQHQVSMTSQLHHQGQPHPFQHHTHVYPQPPTNVALSHGLQQVQPQNLVGRPLMPNQGVQSQPYPQSAGGVQARPVYLSGNQQSANQNNMLKTSDQVQLPSEQHSGGNSRPIMSERQSDLVFEKSMPLQETEVLPPKTGKIVANDLDSAPGSDADVSEVKIEKSETDMMFKDNEHKSKVEDKTSQKKILQSTEMSIDPESHYMENGEPKIKPLMKEVKQESILEHSTNGKLGEVVAEDTKDVLDGETKQIEHSVLENKEIMDVSQLKNLPSQVAKLHEEQGGNLQKDCISGSDESLQAVSTASAPTVGCRAQDASSGGTVLGNEKIQSNQYGFQDKALPQVPGAGGFVEPSHPLPISDLGRPHYGSSTLPLRPGAPSLLQAPPPGLPHQSQGLGHPPTNFRPQGPGHVPGQPFHPPGGIQERGSTATFGRGPGQYGPVHRSFDIQSGAPPGPYNQGHVPAPPFGAVPPSAFDSHRGMMARATPHGPEGRMSLQHPPDALEAEMFPNQRPDHMDGRQRDPFLPGSLEQGNLAQPSGIHQNLMRTNGTPGFDSSSTLGSRDERFKPLLDERLNSMPPGPDRRGFDRAEFEDDLKQFPRPTVLDAETIPKFRNISSRHYDRGPLGGKYDVGLKLDPGTGSTSSRFLSPYHRGGALQANEVGERPVGLHEDIIGRAEPNHGHPDFFGPVPAYGRHHMDSLPPQSPSREHPGISSRGFGGSGYDDYEGRELHRFGEPVGNAFHEGRFTMLPSHLRRGEFEGPGNMRMGEHFRNDFIGQDNLPSHLRRGEHLGPRNLHFGEPVGFGVHPHHAQIGGMAGPGSFESFAGGNRPSYPRFGEPGFRSSFSLQGFPNDGGPYTGDMEFHNLRKRIPASSGWCRICKVDCETVEGLDLHSQTREHQKLSMDIVLSIKQTAKKQKLTSGDRSLLGDASKSRNAGAEGRAKNN